jgi:hypothetical protein
VWEQRRFNSKIGFGKYDDNLMQLSDALQSEKGNTTKSPFQGYQLMPRIDCESNGSSAMFDFRSNYFE